MKAPLLAVLSVILIVGIESRKINFERLASESCEVCNQQVMTHEVHEERFSEVAISTISNIVEKTGVLKAQDQMRGVLIAPNRILSTASYFAEREGKEFYAYYGFLENIDDAEGFQKLKVTQVFIHPLYFKNQGKYNVAVTEVGKKFVGPFAHVSKERFHFIGRHIDEQCNIISYFLGNAVQVLNVNIIPREECLDRYRVQQRNINLSENCFCVTVQNNAEIPQGFNIIGAPVVCETTVHGLIVFQMYKDLKPSDPIPVLDVGVESFWVQRKALHLKSVHLTSAGAFLHSKLELLLPLYWMIKLYKYFY